MAKRNRFYTDGTVVVDDGLFSGINRVEYHLISHSLAEVVELRSEQFFQFGMGIDMQVGGTFQHSEGGNQSHQAEAVVAVQMGNEYVVQSPEAES